MPAKSKDQQRAAGIALQAKRDNKVDELPDGAAKNMAKSMSEKELEKLASTERKGLPKDLPESENREWVGISLAEVFKEEMLGVSTEDDEEEQITTQKSKTERLEDREIGTGKDVEDMWTSTAGGTSPALASHSRGPMSSNTMGARVVESVDVARWQQLAGMLKEAHDKVAKLEAGEKLCPKCNGTGLKDGHGDVDSPMQTPAMCEVCKGKGKLKKESVKESTLKEMSDAQLKRYVRRLAQHGWTWEKVAQQLKDQYGVAPFDIKNLQPEFQDEAGKVKTESNKKSSKVIKTVNENDLSILFDEE